MSMQDPVADMLTRLRNAGMADKQDVLVPESKMKTAIAEVLKSEGYIADVDKEGEGVDRMLRLQLKYRGGVPVIEGIQRVSKPSKRVYCGCSDIPNVRNGLGIAILSTPKGVISGRVAKAENVGGEVLCYVW